MLGALSHAPVGSLPKIAKPILASVLARRRLFRRLDQTRRRPVIWLSSPAGSGKSTLVANYLDIRELSYLWYQIDSSDNDPASFFYYLGLATNKATGTRRAMPLFTPEWAGGLSAFTRTFFREVYGRFRGPAVLVFDNYQDAQPDGPLPTVMRDALAEIPASSSVVVVSRNDPPGELSLLRAQQRMAILSWEDLRLTPEETRRIAKLKAGPGRLKKGIAETLHRQTDGWLAGLILSLEQRGSAVNDEPIHDDYRQSVFDYLGGEVLREMDAATRDVLFKTALLPRINPQLAQTITGHARAGRILSRWARRGFLVSRHGGKPPTYQLHPLLRGFLLERAEQNLGAGVLADARRRAVQALVEVGRGDEAVELLCELADWPRLTEVVCANAPDLIAQGRHQTLESWLKGVPSQHLHDSAWLSFWRGTARMPFAPLLARDDLIRALELFRGAGEGIHAVSACTALIETFAIAWRFRGLREWVAVLEELLASEKSVPAHVEMRALCAMCFALTWVAPADPNLPGLVERIENAVDTVPEASGRVRIAAMLALQYQWFGDFASEQRVLEGVRPSARPEIADPVSLTMFDAIDVNHHWLRGEAEQACAVVDQAVERIGTWEVGSWGFVVRNHAVYACLEAGDIEGAKSYLRRAEEVGFGDNPFGQAHHSFLRAGLALMLGKPEQAAARFRRSLDASLAEGVPFPAALNRFNLGGVLCEVGRFDEAEAELAQALATGEAMGSRTLISDCLLSLSEIALATGDPQRARELLAAGWKCAAQSDYPLTLFWRRGALAQRCAEALQHDIESTFVRRVIRIRRLLAPQRLAQPAAWPWEVVVRALGPLNIEVGGGGRGVAPKGKRKPLALLAALIAAGDRAVNQTKLGDLIWPDADGDRQARALRTNVHRLRTLLGSKEALVSDGGTLSLDPSRVYVDAFAFERLLLEAKRDDTSAVDLWQQAVELYRGPLLADREDESWLISTRERLHRLYRGAVEHLAIAWVAAGSETAARELHQRALACESPVQACSRPNSD